MRKSKWFQDIKSHSTKYEQVQCNKIKEGKNQVKSIKLVTTKLAGPKLKKEIYFYTFWSCSLYVNKDYIPKYHKGNFGKLCQKSALLIFVNNVRYKNEQNGF